MNTTQQAVYQQFGLVNTRSMFEKAVTGGYAVGAYNINNLEQLQAILLGCVETNAPVILQISKGARNYAHPSLLRAMASGAMDFVRAHDSSIPVALHLDHGDSFELCKWCVDNGFSSVMIDASHLPYEDNIALSKQVVEYAHPLGVSVEAELGVLAGIEEDVVAAESVYTQPEEVIDFVSRTGVDSLAISIGTSHGTNKFTPEQCTRNADGILVGPPLRFDILHEIEEKLPGFPIVLHGSSSVMPDYIHDILSFGGHIENPVGVAETQLREAAKSAVCKMNIDSDGRLAMTAAVRKFLSENTESFDPRHYFGAARERLKELVKYKNTHVLGSANQA
ncbi:MAG: class II fructose-1,6-bisphosphate aldolase [Candidatus Marinamargulisbacteria bacterium]|nr:class II fructose-1,6-bisphosphate aldolase [Candidatus Marinamargulisbacteria bacterium]